MTDNKKNVGNPDKRSREERLAEQLRANLRRRKQAARKASGLERPKKDTLEP